MRVKQDWLPFISNEKLCEILRDLKATADLAKQKADKKFARNVIDPFTTLFQMRLLSIPASHWPVVEKQRQIEKSLQNHIGNFHQKLLGSLTGWCNLGVGSVIDLVSDEKKIIAEIKNKHNTVKASDLAGLYDKLSELVHKKGQKYYGYRAYYVEIVPKRPERYDVAFTPPDNTTGSHKPEASLIRKIDGASFYTLATGYEDALRQLYLAIPEAFQTIGLQPATEQEKDLLIRYFEDAFGSS